MDAMLHCVVFVRTEAARTCCAQLLLPSLLLQAVAVDAVQVGDEWSPADRCIPSCSLSRWARASAPTRSAGAPFPTRTWPGQSPTRRPASPTSMHTSTPGMLLSVDACERSRARAHVGRRVAVRRLEAAPNAPFPSPPARLHAYISLEGLRGWRAAEPRETARSRALSWRATTKP